MTLNRQVWPGEYNHGTERQPGQAVEPLWSFGLEQPDRCEPENASEPDLDRVSPALRDEVQLLKRLGFSKPALARCVRRAVQNASTVEEELLANEGVEPEAYYAALARTAGLPFFSDIDPAAIIGVSGDETQLAEPKVVRLVARDRQAVTALVPTAAMMARLCERLTVLPALSRQLVITTPAAIRQAMWRRGRQERVQAATNALFDARPRLSARIVVSGSQGFVLGAGVMALVAAFLVSPLDMLLLAHIAGSLFFAAALMLRAAALFRFKRRRQRKYLTRLRVTDDCAPPIYTVMIALYREHAVVAQLLKALDGLDWPKSRLDVKLLCEEDDSETIDAIRRLRPPGYVDVVEVPAAGPRTKPKALNYGLTAARGTYLVIYDAEDRPDPGQLREAWERFESRAMNVACLQAPLVISNPRGSWISALFALEYAGLFRCLLPMLADRRLPLPLGGTSNHFRIDALRQVGAWDPFNVTEDADLGLRLYRSGLRAEVLTTPTYEEAPQAGGIWVKQRTRWFKGWLQTWLVTLRNAPGAMGEMGPWPFLVTQLMIGGMLVSALLHPALLLFVGLTAVKLLALPSASVDWSRLVLFWMDLVNIFGAYACFLAMGGKAMERMEWEAVRRRVIAIPLYWMMMTVAAWRAVFDLSRRPHFWEKTPHAPLEPDMPVESEAEITLRHLRALRQAILRRSVEIWSG
ncbi:glycosyltransferase [Rhizobium halophytocola]|uniref:glycosyltransferase n=1 Tax=Rhizobium halophytocola TaxID=735519 RepID=UPI00315874EA